VKVAAPSLVLRRILGLERKNRVTVPVQIEQELVIAMKLRALNRHDLINMALEDRLMSMNVPVDQPVPVKP